MKIHTEMERGGKKQRVEGIKGKIKKRNEKEWNK
jgi:hypothetical protein